MKPGPKRSTPNWQGRRLRAARVRAGVTLLQIATTVGKTKQAVHHWELNHRTPRRPDITAMERLLRTRLT